MDAISSALIGKALDALSIRQIFSAQNIANANTPDYRAVEVSFEDSLRQAASNGVDAISQVVPKTQMKNMDGVSADMRLDIELAIASQTAMRYSSLVNVLSRQMALTRSAISPGR